MKRLPVTCLALFVLLTVVSPVFADGILTLPGGEGAGQVMPLVGVDVTVEIHDQIAITTVRNTFVVQADDTCNVVFHYKLPATASVTGFGVWQNDSLQMFDLRAGAHGGNDTGGIGQQDHSLLDYLGSNPFVIGLNATPPGILMTELRFVQLLGYDFGVVTYEYPLLTDPFLAGSIDTVTIRGTYESQRNVLEIFCNYADNLQINPVDEYHGEFVLNLAACHPDEDFQITLNYNQADIGAWILTHRSDHDRAGYFMLIIDPGIVDTSESVPKYFTFVVDRSGSMRGTKIVQAKSAILRCLDNLLPHDYFNIVDFSTDVRQFSGTLVPANEEELSDARNYVSAIQPTASTNIYGALMTAVEQQMAEGTANQIVFATDGLPNVGVSGDPDVIVHDVTEANDFNARIYSFGIGVDLNVRFLTALSEANSGEAIIFDPENAPIDQIVDDFYSRQSRPALVNPVIHFWGNEPETDSLYPPTLQNVAAGNQLYLFGRYSAFGDFDLELSGRMLGGDTTLYFEQIPFPEENLGNEFVPRLWAKSVIDYWLKWMLIHGENQTVIDKIIELSLEYGILTPYTGFSDPDDPPPPPDDSNANALWEPDLSQFNAVSTINGTVLSWTVTGVSGALSFNVFKGPTPLGPWTKLNDGPINQCSYLDATGSTGELAYYKIEVFFDDHSWRSEALNSGVLPDIIVLNEPYPNPFNSRAIISFSVPKDGATNLAIYSLDGREVVQLLNGKVKAGAHRIEVNGTNLASGAYMLQLKSEGVIASQRLVIIK